MLLEPGCPITTLLCIAIQLGVEVKIQQWSRLFCAWFSWLYILLLLNLHSGLPFTDLDSHGPVLTFCRGVIILSLLDFAHRVVAAVLLTFHQSGFLICRRQSNPYTTEHGISWTFCRGALQYTPFFYRTFCGGVQECIHGHTGTFCRGVQRFLLTNWFTPFFPWIFCGGIINIISICLHGNWLTFCRGVLSSIQQLVLLGSHKLAQLFSTGIQHFSLWRCKCPPLALARKDRTQGAPVYNPTGKPGPKSGGFGFVSILLLLLIYMQVPNGHQNWGEGSCLQSWETGRATIQHYPEPLLEAKTHDHAPPEDSGPSQCRRSVQKRSYKRACLRAQRHGFAWYKGRLYKPEDFDGVSTLTPSPANKRNPRQPVKPPPPMCPSGRLQVLHLNVGGVTSDRVQEICLWAEQRSVDVIILSETRWSFTTEWTRGPWNFLHSGTQQDRADGLLLMVHRRVCPVERLGYAEIMPGRMVHLRLHFDRRNFDLICCYQFADARNAARDAQRRQFWDQLYQYATGLPNRNAILYVGDFNCSLSPDGTHVGTNQFNLNGQTLTGHLHRDSDVFMRFLKQNHLTAVNSWNARDPPSFLNGIVGSKIDHFLMRIADCDSHCKQIAYYPNADFLPLTGARHIHMLCTMRKIPYIFTKTAGMQSCSFSQRLTCRNAWQENGNQWQSFCRESQALFDSFAAQPHQSQTIIDDLHKCLMPCFQTHFPKMSNATTQPAQDHTTVLNKWEHRRKVQECASCRMPDLIRIWYHWTQFSKLKREQARHSKLLKKRQLQDLLADAQTAAGRHDGFGLYQLINKYSPKQPRRRIRLRNTDGHPASAMESLNMMTQFVQDLWQGPSVVEFDRSQPCEIPFSLEELVEEIAKIPAVKAVAKPYLPGLYWKTFAEPVANMLYALLEEWWGTAPIFIPDQWKQAWLTFLPKPQKQPSSVMNLRPIALQEPLDKAVLGLITQKFQKELHPHLIGHPQFAFIAHRSALDAIRKVAIHCIEVRTLLQAQRRTVQQRRDGDECHQVCGGVQLLLDVSRAFDMLPRAPLFQFIHALPISSQLTSILAEWHSNTTYVVQQADACNTIPTGRGVRQGCRAAPVLWTCFTEQLFRQLERALGSEWVRAALTLFADDLHCGQTFTTAQALLTSLKNIGIILDAFETSGLAVSYAKSVLLIAIGGTNSRKIRQQVIQTGPTGPFVRIPRQNGRFTELPVKLTATYLGVQINYRNHEECTLQSRTKTAKTAFMRLRRWLCSKRLALRTKLQLWKSCVYSTLTYGIFATDVTYAILYTL